MKKINFNKIFDLVFWSIIIIMTLMEIYTKIDIADFQNVNFQDIATSEYITIVLTIFFVIVVSVVSSMLRVFWLTALYIGIKIANKKYNKERIEKVDLKNDSYYRDILPKYSPSVLSYVDDFKIYAKNHPISPRV